MRLSFHEDTLFYRLYFTRLGFKSGTNICSQTISFYNSIILEHLSFFFLSWCYRHVYERNYEPAIYPEVINSDRRDIKIDLVS